MLDILHKDRQIIRDIHDYVQIISLLPLSWRMQIANVHIVQ